MEAVGRLQDYRRVGPLPRSADGDDVFPDLDQAGVRGHEGDFHGHLDPVTEGAERVGDDLIDLVGAEFVPHGAPDAAEGMLAGEHPDAALLQFPPVLLVHFLDIGLGKSRHVRDGDDIESLAETIQGLEGGSAAGRCDDDGPDVQCFGAAGHGLEEGGSVPRSGLGKVPDGDVGIGRFFQEGAPSRQEAGDVS